VINGDVQVEGISEGNELFDSNQGVLVEYQGKEWAEDPELGVTAAGPDRVHGEEDHYMEHGFDPEGDEPIGADEEWRYFKRQQKVAEGRSNEKVQQQEGRSRVENKGSAYEGTDPDVVPSDEATMIGDATYFAHTTYDRDNPDIKEGSTFADKDAFMLVMKQYAIKREFHTMVVHSDKSRYRARCADLECEWKVYAKKLLGCPTFMVFMYCFQIAHICVI
jgi:hypothetical protein